MKDHFTGAGIQHFTGKALSRLRVNFPPITDVSEYVSNFDFLLSEVRKLESVYEGKLKALDELKKSILQKAFSGALTQKDAA